MQTAAVSIENANDDASLEPLAARIAQAAITLTPDDLSAQVTAADVRERFLKEATRTLGERHATRIEKFIDGIEHHEDAGLLAALLGNPANNNGD
jgi:hypothetical protein